MCLGIPGQIIGVEDDTNCIATVEISGVRRPVNIACVLNGQTPKACVGEWVLVHVGFAMSRIDSEEAEKTLALLAEIGELQEELEAIEHASYHAHREDGSHEIR
ncbi:HypC/HybG/HupF family hydrogenase formation chaperone [Grimontia hollisae]|uniref:[NiFe] hydrogenase metallocenter assembly protein HypC n=1 Tax=Grimontia hollisae CIP 101886 TaxID=675812 RepID=D0IAG3_GRIHO|nr:HypC/HybG/HupF family hydrogenase formation chaperone [Grimontia hollisae]AMG31853.1 HypC/HybG/HupF family hydrogenase formation chaperone [Grimontia hollisae]EEY70881.1 [NiFe] hydrogenase metallocenter assembly protein HypC [Grimontia hollisae CIP 101886]MDF2186288.1 HypC/HybG/HupF family hydrogenase formation chaperone [Grimontia hollisae]STO44617.1 Hydrogenase isoenzymes formation protein hypC [Grimontia hollisae]